MSLLKITMIYIPRYFNRVYLSDSESWHYLGFNNGGCCARHILMNDLLDCGVMSYMQLKWDLGDEVDKI